MPSTDREAQARAPSPPAWRAHDASPRPLRPVSQLDLAEVEATEDVGGPEVELRLVVRGERRVPATLGASARAGPRRLNRACGVTEPGRARTWPRRTSSRRTPRSSTAALSPASTGPGVLPNDSLPVATDATVAPSPTTSTASPTREHAVLDVTGHDVPRPLIVEHALDRHQERPSSSRTGSGTYPSTASSSPATDATHRSSPSSARSAETGTTGTSSPGKPYSVSRSRTSSSTRSSSSGSSTVSALLSARRRRARRRDERARCAHASGAWRHRWRRRPRWRHRPGPRR